MAPAIITIGKDRARTGRVVQKLEAFKTGDVILLSQCPLHIMIRVQRIDNSLLSSTQPSWQRCYTTTTTTITPVVVSTTTRDAVVASIAAIIVLSIDRRLLLTVESINIIS